jgi:hypothetical protein
MVRRQGSSSDGNRAKFVSRFARLEDVRWKSMLALFDGTLRGERRPEPR